MKNLNTLDWIALVLVIVGGLNWGLVGLFNLDLVQTLFRAIPVLAQIIYILVGLAAIYLAVISMQLCRK